MVSSETQIQAPLVDLEESFFATSSEEFFNETSFPRYHLAAKPFGLIQYPNKANPKIALFGEQIDIIVNTSSGTTGWNFTLTATQLVAKSIFNLEIEFKTAVIPLFSVLLAGDKLLERG